MKLRIEDIRGAARCMPWTMAAFVLAGFSLIGIPGTAGFISKWYLISAALQEGKLGIFLVVIVLLSSLMAVAYIWRVIEAAYFGEAKDTPQTVTEAPWPLLVATWIVVLANVYFGLFPSLQLSLSVQAAESLLEHLQ